jgi:signal transduction histidine kinase
LNLYVWDRTRDALSVAGVSRKELDALAGVSLYRDGLRVLPYGEPGNDWLFLDQERIQAPSERVGNNQVIGLVEVDQSSNLRLRDKTNREGLIENDSFLDMRVLARAAIRLFTTYWRADRPVLAAGGSSTEPAEPVAGARRTARAIRASARDDVNVDLPPTTTPTVPPTRFPGPSQDGATTPTPSQDGAASRTVNQREAADLLLGELDEVQRSIRGQYEQFDRLLQLAAAGLAAERVVHEFGRQVTAASDAVHQLRSAPGVNGDALSALRAVIATLEAEFRVLAPYESTRRGPRARDASVTDLAKLALELNRRILDTGDAEAEIVGDEFFVTTRGTQILQILDNLVHNAAYWVTKARIGQRRRIAVVVNASDRTVVVADNGPGISSEEVRLVFEPHFSMKEGGSGLGLYISAQLAKSAGGQLICISAGPGKARLPDWATGAAFQLTLFTKAGRTDG